MSGRTSGTGALAASLAGGGGAVYNLTVHAGLGTDGRSIGAQIVAALKQYEIDNGTRWRTV